MSVLLKYGFEDLVAYMEEKKRFRFLKRLIPKSSYQHAMHLTKWEKMRMVCEELGPTFVKFGQILSNRPDLLPADLIKELEKLQDSVPPIDGKLAKLVVEQEMKKSIGELFSFFETAAFASASMAQVHRATLKTGEKVVVKIQRPGIKEMIEADIKVMIYIAEILSVRIPSLKSFDPLGLVRNFEESITKELDFIHESVNVQRFHNNFLEDDRDEGWIHSPKVFSEYTTSRILTLELIDGIKISDLERLSGSGLDRKIIAKRLAISYFKQIFNYGFFHADPHPGNLFVLPMNVICYLDYGMMGSIMKKDIEQIGYLFVSVNKKDVRKILRALTQLSDNPQIQNYRELESDLNEFVQNYSFRSIHNNEMSTVLLALKDIIVKHGLKVPSHFFLLARSMVTIEGVIKFLDPELDLTLLIRPYLVRTIAKHYNPLQFGKRVLNSLYEMGMYMEDFPRDLKNAILKINSGELKVDLRHKGIDPLVHTINRVTRQIISAVIVSALIIGSSLMVVYDVPPLWGATSSFGIVGFILGGIILLGMMRDFRKGDHDEWVGWED
ncbi:MAG TPA: AarF/UbiB family protein [Bacteroidia bacterium]